MRHTGALVTPVAAGEVALTGWGFCGEVEGDRSQDPTWQAASLKSVLMILFHAGHLRWFPKPVWYSAVCEDPTGNEVKGARNLATWVGKDSFGGQSNKQIKNYMKWTGRKESRERAWETAEGRRLISAETERHGDKSQAIKGSGHRENCD